MGERRGTFIGLTGLLPVPHLIGEFVLFVASSATLSHSVARDSPRLVMGQFDLLGEYVI